jgi:DNA-binding MarR family transcriptional regulator
MMAATSDSFTDEQRAAWFGFLTAHSVLTRELDALLGAAHGMALVEFEVLLKLWLAGGRLRMSELADAALVSRSGLTRIVDELERLGLVSREPDEHDGRVLLATITPLGRRRLRTARKSHLAHVHRLFLDRLTATQQHALAESWEAILGGLDADVPRRRRAGRGAAATATRA